MLKKHDNRPFTRTDDDNEALKKQSPTPAVPKTNKNKKHRSNEKPGSQLQQSKHSKLTASIHALRNLRLLFPLRNSTGPKII